MFPTCCRYLFSLLDTGLCAVWTAGSRYETMVVRGPGNNDIVRSRPSHTLLEVMYLPVSGIALGISSDL